MADRLTPIREKLLRRGARLGDVLMEHELASFEQRHRVTLPDGYRNFLLLIGNGGAGPPCYGCAKLGDAAADMTPDEKSYWTTLPDIAKPFPFTNPWVWENGEESAEGTTDQINHGSIYVGNDGCGQYWHLIVAGPERGNVWQFCGVGIVPTIPKRDFLKWYEDWLDGVENWCV
jgi:hypothetical protein